MGWVGGYGGKRGEGRGERGERGEGNSFACGKAGNASKDDSFPILL